MISEKKEWDRHHELLCISAAVDFDSALWNSSFTRAIYIELCDRIDAERIDINYR